MYDELRAIRDPSGAPRDLVGYWIDITERCRAQAAFSADILASGQRLLALVEGILKMSRLDATGSALEREPVEIGAAFEERVAELHGGTIEVKSELGKGRTFTPRFPTQEMV